MKLKKLTLKDKRRVGRFLSLGRHYLSCYAFENIYIWKDLFDIYLGEFRGHLLIFFENRSGSFLYLPPLGRSPDPAVVAKAFDIMEGRSRNKNIPRIENIEEEDAAFYKTRGYECIYKSSDYICDRSDLAGLKGDRFKNKRKCANYFVKHYKYEYLPFAPGYKEECLGLYDLWMAQRKSKNRDTLYLAMMEDNGTALKVMLDTYKNLGCAGRIVKVGGKVRGFTFGYELNSDIFCVLYEITDLSVRGLAQFIFREFCRELNHRYINIMDDSGLQNLKRVKLSYRPRILSPSYIIGRKLVR